MSPLRIRAIAGRALPGSTSRGALLAVGLVLAVTPARAQSDRYAPSANDFGGVGLLQTRTARFHKDGTLEVGGSFIYPYYRYYVTFQPLPWVEATFRYSDITNRLYSSVEEFSGDQSYKDRGADLKFKLLSEGDYLPQIAVGFQDGLGTGLFSSEYIVASKRWYDLDFHFGVAWGYLGHGGSFENPLISFAEGFRNRTGDSAQGGALNFGSYFSGETVGFFGGVDWRTPIRGLTVKLEYDGNDYQNEPLDNRFEVDLPVNFGLVYRPFNWLDLSAAFERGNEVMFRLSLRGDLKTPGMMKLDEEPPKLEPRPRPAPGGPAQDTTGAPEQFRQPSDPALAAAPAELKEAHAGQLWRGDEVAAQDAVFDALEAAGVEVEAVEVIGAEARIYLAETSASDAMPGPNEAGRIAAANLPPSIERMTLVRQAADGGPEELSWNRTELEQTAVVDALFDGLESRGYEVQSLDITQQEVEIAISGAVPSDGEAERAAAQLLFSELRAPIERVAFVGMQAGMETRRVVLHRDEVKHAARVDRMFDGFEANGFAIESFEITRGQATVHLSVGTEATEEDLRKAAQLVADSSPDPLREVVVIGLQAGVEAARVALRRPAMPAGRSVGAEAPAVSGAGAAPGLSEEQKTAVADKLFRALEEEGLVVDAVRLTDLKATVFVTPTRFRQLARNVGRAARVVAMHAPDSIEEIEVVLLSTGLEISRVSIMRRDLEDAVAGRGSPEEIWANAVIEAPEPAILSTSIVPEDAVVNEARYPSFNWSIRPALRQHIGGPDDFYLFQIYLDLSATAELYRGLSVTGSIIKNLYNTFDKLSTTSNSRLPHVRSDIVQYLKEGEDGAIGRLQADYLFSPARNVYARLSAGLFEEMFGGVGAEVLYRPYGSRWAVGADINRVRQREFKQRFGFRDYEVTTGHVNLYYKFPFYDLVGEIHAGQFLAGDRGAQFGLSRVFDSGIRIGAWATFTDVPFEVFGEGSFDKGFYVTIPFDVFLTNSTRRGATFGFRPLTRDGGQMLGIARRLYPIVDSGNLDQVMHDWDQFLD